MDAPRSMIGDTRPMIAAMNIACIQVIATVTSPAPHLLKSTIMRSASVRFTRMARGQRLYAETGGYILTPLAPVVGGGSGTKICQNSFLHVLFSSPDLLKIDVFESLKRFLIIFCYVFAFLAY